ncbi:hypothetical protein ACFFWD_15795 [Bradyrhizobium erythrophlei]|uniref:hypothetical protein n=1 Tax=Bradyrhizobium erythrophlei TaxID=1437360 RepID=UPI0035EC9DC8
MTKKMAERCVFWLCLGLVLICRGGLAVTSGGARANDSTLVDKVKSTWRAQDGETVEQIISNVSKVAHFVPRTWGIVQPHDGAEYVFFSWAKHPNDKSDEYAILWKLAADGAMKIGSPYARPMELGWRAFALSLIASEVADGQRGGEPSLFA